MSRTLRDVVDELGYLTRGEIVDLLRTKGIKGVRVHAGACPIARYVARETKTRGDVRAGSMYISICHGFVVGHPYENRWEEIHTPDSCRAFMHMFDKGYYPDLEENDKSGEMVWATTTTPW